MSRFPLPAPFAGHGAAFAGLVIIVFIAVCAVFAPWLAPADPLEINPIARLSPPGGEHWLGTDHYGRDTLSRVMHGARMALFIGVGVVLLALGGGIAFGVTSAIFPRLGIALMRIVDVLMAFPALLLALALIVILGPGVENSIVAISAVYLTTTARIVYGVSLRLNSEPWVEAARGMGARVPRVVFRHILPNLVSPRIVRGLAPTEQRALGGGGTRDGSEGAACRVQAHPSEPRVTAVRSGELRIRVRPPRSISSGSGCRRKHPRGETC